MIERDVARVNVIDPLDGLEITEADLHAVGPAFAQKPVIKAFTVPDAMALLVETHSGHKNHIDFLRLDVFIMERLVNVPNVLYKLGVGRELQILHFARIKYNTRNESLNVREFLPEPFEYQSCIDLVEFFDGDEAVKKFDGSEIKIFKKTVGDLTASFCALFG